MKLMDKEAALIHDEVLLVLPSLIRPRPRPQAASNKTQDFLAWRAAGHFRSAFCVLLLFPVSPLFRGRLPAPLPCPIFQFCFTNDVFQDILSVMREGNVSSVAP